MGPSSRVVLCSTILAIIGGTVRYSRIVLRVFRRGPRFSRDRQRVLRCGRIMLRGWIGFILLPGYWGMLPGWIGQRLRVNGG